ncbi:hypothetical protein HYFRA_00009588 [Hymenoscyphus fraxineus]|uniref:Uncharacterized protein n=1 Tax=Hymenoscyphus fraxineus TaxID=746836 RepID=A0A9N9KXE2_9HELO|nr:hypothetical protein HYFRA_00009588 [Hymenoscyphus fraxineus]
MKFIIILAFSAMAAAQALKEPFNMDCNGGTEGDGGCEANGLATYCCVFKPQVGFDTKRPTTVTSRNRGGSDKCGPNNIGTIRCAPK